MSKTSDTTTEGQSPEDDALRKPTVEEAEAILTLVRGGWLRLELTLDETVIPPAMTEATR